MEEIIWHKCRECQHIKKYEYGGRRYCEKQYDSRTVHGHKKIKPNDNICPMFQIIVK